MNKIKRALTGAAVLGSLVLGGNALADERPKVNAHNCPAGQEIYVLLHYYHCVHQHKFLVLLDKKFMLMDTMIIMKKYK